MFRHSWFSFFLSMALTALSVVGCNTAPVDDTCEVDCGVDPGDDNVDGVEEVDFEGFAVAPPPASGDPGNDKDSFEEKMAALVDSAEVPSALGGAFLQLSRAYLSGREPVTQIEISAFEILDRATPDVINAIARTLDRIDELPAGDMNKLYPTDFLDAPSDQPLTHSVLSTALVSEIRQRAALAELGSVQPLEQERPGAVRDGYCFDVDVGTIPGACPNVCSIRTASTGTSLRTAAHIPYLSAGDYRPQELQRECVVDAGGNLDCSNVTPPDCKGSTGSVSNNPVCLAVPVVQAGEVVTLHGFNFHDVDAVVMLNGVHPSQVRREVSAHVVGDEVTPADATVDCRISDRVSFAVPTDLPVGVYYVGVGVANPDRPDRRMFGFNNPYIQVVPPPTARFSMTSEELTCLDTTDGEWGSDEIGVKIITVPVAADGSLGEMDSIDFDFGDVDRGERRTMDRVHFSGSARNGFGFTVIGYEIDSRDAYKNTIRGFEDAFVEITKSNWSAVSATVGTVAGGIVTIFGGPALGAAVGAAITFAMNVIVAAWAPADLVIEDWGSKSFLQLSDLTSLNVANPSPETRISGQGVKVLVEACEDTEELDRPGCDANAKSAQQYRERRLYEYKVPETCSSPFCFAQGSRYQITFRYNRLD